MISEFNGNIDSTLTVLTKNDQIGHLVRPVNLNRPQIHIPERDRELMDARLPYPVLGGPVNRAGGHFRETGFIPVHAGPVPISAHNDGVGASMQQLQQPLPRVLLSLDLLH